MNAIDKRESEAFWYMKAFAVVAIVACHCTHVSENAGIINRCTRMFFEFWMQCGVPVFFFAAGFFLNAGDSPRTVGKFWIKKAKTIVVPWIVTGTAVWLYIVLRKGGISLEGWVRYLFMRESYLYFLSDLMFFYLLFFAIYKNEACILGVGVILFVATISVRGGQPQSLLHLTEWHGFALLNLWMFYIGIVARRSDFHKKCRHIGYCTGILLYTIARYFQNYTEVSTGGTLMGTVYMMVFVVGLYSLCYNLAAKPHPILLQMGQNSFTIYLCHMPFAGVISNLLNRSEKFALLTLWRPVIVIALTMLFIRWYVIVVGENEKWLALIGVRDNC